MYVADMAISTEPRVLGRLLQIVFVSKLHEYVPIPMKKIYQCTSELLSIWYTVDTGHFFHTSLIQCLIFFRHTLMSRIQNLSLF